MNKTEMASSTSGKCSSTSTTGLPSSGSDLPQRELIDERKRKRRESNRESARRSRVNKRNHLHELTAQVCQLRNENNHLIVKIGLMTQRNIVMEAENSSLSAQIQELNHRVEALNEIIVGKGGVGIEKGQGGGDCGGFGGGGDGVMNPLNLNC